MAQSLPTVTMKKNTWVDIYNATGITAGTQLIIQNTGESDVNLVESASEPDNSIGHNLLIPTQFFTNTAANVGAWGFSQRGTILQVEES